MEDESDLTQAEIWDDSVLVKSWNDAFEEYKKYHSLAVKGERVVLEKTTKPKTKVKDVSDEGDKGNHGETSASQRNAGVTTQTAASAEGHSAPLSAPSAFMSNVQDESLKNLMMSWYYAGYYTGLYEGKQQAFATMQQDDE